MRTLDAWELGQHDMKHPMNYVLCILIHMQRFKFYPNATLKVRTSPQIMDSYGAAFFVLYFCQREGGGGSLGIQ